MTDTFCIYESLESLDGHSGFAGEWLPEAYNSSRAALAAWRRSQGRECRSPHSAAGSDHEHHVIAEVFRVPAGVDFETLSDDERFSLEQVASSGPHIP